MQNLMKAFLIQSQYSGYARQKFAVRNVIERESGGVLQ